MTATASGGTSGGRTPQPLPPYRLAHEPDGTSWTARENLTDILTRELLGPRDGDHEVIQDLPEALYLLGRIAPAKLKPADAAGDPTNPATPESADADDPDTRPLDLGDDLDAGTSRGLPLTSVDDSSTTADEDSGGGEDEPQKRGLMIPASMGLRFQVPLDLPSFTVHASWGSYEPFNTGEVTAKGRAIRHFQRSYVERAATISLSDLRVGLTTEKNLLNDEIKLKLDRHDDLTRNCAIIEVALCNDRLSPRSIPTHVWLFQTRLEVVGGDGSTTPGGSPAAVFLPVNDCTEEDWNESDDELRRLNLHYRNRLEFAVGRTCSADWDVAPGERRATCVRTTWLPTVETPQVQAVQVDAELDMTALAAAGLEELRAGLSPLVSDYTAWLDGQETRARQLPDHLAAEGLEAVAEARLVQRQLREGLDYLLDPAHTEARRCFAFMNHVMAEQRIATQVTERRAANPALSLDQARDEVLASPVPHHWRAFQLAFVLMQIPSLCEPGHRRRSGDNAKVELLFFPTGGGKTEAYLGLAAFVFASRRRDAVTAGGPLATPDGPLNSGDGVAVLMRYTLRLLTAQQFQRATALICAAELVRRAEPDVWGEVPFRIGLWVGTAVSPKRVEEAAKELARLRDGRGFRLTALQLQRCPWCGEVLKPDRDVSYDKPRARILVHCHNTRHGCPFAPGGGPRMPTTVFRC